MIYNKSVFNTILLCCLWNAQIAEGIELFSISCGGSEGLKVDILGDTVHDDAYIADLQEKTRNLDPLIENQKEKNKKLEEQLEKEKLALALYMSKCKQTLKKVKSND